MVREHVREAAALVGDRQSKAADREMWALGDYPRVAREVIAAFGPRLVRACRIGPGRRVLDVAAGSGNVAVAAAEAGAIAIIERRSPAAASTRRCWTRSATPAAGGW